MGNHLIVSLAFSSKTPLMRIDSTDYRYIKFQWWCVVGAAALLLQLVPLVNVFGNVSWQLWQSGSPKRHPTVRSRLALLYLLYFHHHHYCACACACKLQVRPTTNCLAAKRNEASKNNEYILMKAALHSLGPIQDHWLSGAQLQFAGYPAKMSTGCHCVPPIAIKECLVKNNRNSTTATQL